MKKYLVLCFFFLWAFSYSSDITYRDETLYESYIFLRVNEVFSEPFFRVYATEDGKTVYVPVKSLIEFTGISTLDVNLENQSVIGSVLYLDDTTKQISEKQISASYRNSLYVDKDGDAFIEIQGLKKALNLDSLFWDENRSFLSINLGYLLPFEVKDIQHKKKLNLDSSGETLEATENKLIEPDRKLLSPGVLRLEYFISDFEDSGTQNFRALYNTQLLYGDFAVQSSFYPDTKLELITLTYREKLPNKVIILGDATLEKNSILTTNDSFIRGINIVSDNVYTEFESGRLTIRGPVANGTTVELYQNEILIGLQIVNNSNEYLFEDITTFSFSEEFVLKFYYPNGRIEERSLTVIGDNEIQEKGEYDYSLQLGESDNDLAGSAKYLYGITDNITVGARYLKANSLEIDDDDGNEITNEFNIAEGILIMRSGAKRNPTLYRFNWLADLDETSDGTFRGRILKRIWNFSTEVYWDEHSDEVTEVEESERVYGALIGSQFGDFSFNLGYEMNEDIEGDEEDYRLDLRYFLNSNTRLQMNNIYRTFENEEDDDEYEARFNVSYSGFERFNLSLNVENTYRNNEWTDERYSIGIAKKNRTFRKNDIDYSAEVEYSDEEWSFRVFFTYYFTDWFSIPARLTNDDQEIGAAVEKTFILSRLTESNGNPDPGDAWVEGHVFRDENMNGIIDPDEETYKDIEISVSGRRATTDENGYYYIDGVAPISVQEVTPMSASVDPLLTFSNDKYDLKALPASGHTVNFSLTPIVGIYGDIEIKATDLTTRERSRAYQQVKIYVMRKSDNTIVASNTSESDGFFTIEGIPPGDYKVEAKYLGDKELTIAEKTYDLYIERSDIGDFYEGFDFQIISN